jgi:hypothetical protein
LAAADHTPRRPFSGAGKERPLPNLDGPCGSRLTELVSGGGPLALKTLNELPPAATQGGDGDVATDIEAFFRVLAGLPR